MKLEFFDALITPKLETELFSTYSDPILSELIADTERNTILRWSNKKQEKNNDFRPDATITKIHQLKHGFNLGHGEVKAKSGVCDYHALCHDLLRLGVFSKDSLDYNKLEYALAFQIHSFSITFYLISLPHHKVYEMIEIAHMKFPRSFLNTPQTLFFICETFWRLCVPASDPEVIKRRYCATQKKIYNIIDSSRDRHRECTLRFEC
ncbi:hypothetical protein BDF14DRAFT_1877797 [Spinellus fusiger]|nr:hypothetical protein BDF14DRAFT_1877797 [Spinellus fusiger]